MNDAQQIFAVFYAIFWGSQFNVIPRWKPLNFGLIFDKDVKNVSRRISVALLILNILPIIYFVIIFLLLNGPNICEAQRKCWIYISIIVLSGIIPAFGIFGFYRIWLFIIETSPHKYYLKHILIPSKYKPFLGAAYAGAYEVEPALEKLSIEPSGEHGRKKNGVVGCAYIILGILSTKLPYAILFIIMLISLFCRPFCWEYLYNISIKLRTLVIVLNIIFIAFIFLVILFISHRYGNDIYFFIENIYVALIYRIPHLMNTYS